MKITPIALGIALVVAACDATALQDATPKSVKATATPATSPSPDLMAETLQVLLGEPNPEDQWDGKTITARLKYKGSSLLKMESESDSNVKICPPPLDSVSCASASAAVILADEQIDALKSAEQGVHQELVEKAKSDGDYSVPLDLYITAQVASASAGIDPTSL